MIQRTYIIIYINRIISWNGGFRLNIAPYIHSPTPIFTTEWCFKNIFIGFSVFPLPTTVRAMSTWCSRSSTVSIIRSTELESLNMLRSSGCAIISEKFRYLRALDFERHDNEFEHTWCRSFFNKSPEPFHVSFFFFFFFFFKILYNLYVS
jgi:hypothetical protein